jgi:hypothetical protein
MSTPMPGSIPLNAMERLMTAPTSRKTASASR